MATMMALEMRSITQTSRSSTHKREEADFKRRLALWKKRHQGKAKQVIASLPESIRAAAGQGYHEMLMRVEIDPPYTFTEAYKELRIDHDFTHTGSGIHLSADKCKILPEASRPIARWALRQGFRVRTFRWEDRDERYLHLHRSYYEVCNFRSLVVAPSAGEERHYPLQEGIVIEW